MPQNAANQSLQRATRILYSVAGSEDGRTTRQISHDIGIKPNTAYRLIRTMEREGLLMRLAQPLRFIIGPAITEIQRLHDERQLLAIAYKALRAASIKMPEANFVLIEPHHDSIFQRLCVESSRPGMVFRRRSTQLNHPYRKASFLLFLALLSHEERRSLMRTYPFEQEGRQIWRTREAMDRYLEKVQALGYSCPEIPDDSDEVSYRLAFPVFSAENTLIAAVAGYLLGAASKASQKQLMSLCRSTARGIQLAIQSPNP